jgi:hypothetical protein
MISVLVIHRDQHSVQLISVQAHWASVVLMLQQTILVLPVLWEPMSVVLVVISVAVAAKQQAAVLPLRAVAAPALVVMEVPQAMVAPQVAVVELRAAVAI